MNVRHRMIVITPPTIVPFGNPPCQPHCPAPGMPSGATSSADFASSRELLATAVATVLDGIPGAAGLGPRRAALAAGATLALANKEALVAGGALVTAAAAPGQIVPVDSEHSALAQRLRGGRAAEVDRLGLTAS